MPGNTETGVRKVRITNVLVYSLVHTARISFQSSCSSDHVHVPAT